MKGKETIERDIADLEADIMQTEEFMAEYEEDLTRLTSPDYKPEDNPDDEFRDVDIMQCEEAIAGYKRDIARYQRKIEILKARLTKLELDAAPPYTTEELNVITDPAAMVHCITRRASKAKPLDPFVKGR